MKGKPKQEQSVEEEQIRTAVNAHWQASAARDADAERDIYADDAVCRVEPVFVTTVRAVWVSGAVVYEPEPLDKPADGNRLVCCSQPTIDVVVDL